MGARHLRWARLDRVGYGRRDLWRVVERVSGFSDGRARHASGIEGASFQVDRALDMERFLRWMDAVLALRGDDVLRMKAILDFEGRDRKFVFQAVNRIMDGDFLGSWGSDARNFKLVVIGRNLDRDRIRRNFEGCQVPLVSSRHDAGPATYSNKSAQVGRHKALLTNVRSWNEAN